MDDEFRWPDDRPAVLRDGLTAPDVIEALYASTSLQFDSRTPVEAPTFLVRCAPTADVRLVVVICTRSGPAEPWTIKGARDAGPEERTMWRKHTS